MLSLRLSGAVQSEVWHDGLGYDSMSNSFSNAIRIPINIALAV